MQPFEFWVSFETKYYRWASFLHLKWSDTFWLLFRKRFRAKAINFTMVSKGFFNLVKFTQISGEIVKIQGKVFKFQGEVSNVCQSTITRVICLFNANQIWITIPNFLDKKSSNFTEKVIWLKNELLALFIGRLVHYGFLLKSFFFVRPNHFC